MEAQAVFWKSMGMWLLEHKLDFTLWHSCSSWHEVFIRTSKNTNQTPKSCNHTPLQTTAPSSITERQDCGNPGEIPIPLVPKRLENHCVPWKGGDGCI